MRIYNEKEVDELVVLDIDATVKGAEPDYQLISLLASECRMPLCYGGGVRTADQIEKIISLGVEKVAISSAVIGTPGLITDAASRIGSQSVVVVMDVKKMVSSIRYEVVTHNATRTTGINPVEWAKRMTDAGAGEVVVNSVDCDGAMKGYDFELIDQVREATSLPMTVLGGAGSLEDFKKLFRRYGIVGAAAGSLFVFKGKYRAVLINYPSRADKDEILASTDPRA